MKSNKAKLRLANKASYKTKGLNTRSNLAKGLKRHWEATKQYGRDTKAQGKDWMSEHRKIAKDRNKKFNQNLSTKQSKYNSIARAKSKNFLEGTGSLKSRLSILRGSKSLADSKARVTAAKSNPSLKGNLSFRTNTGIKNTVNAHPQHGSTGRAIITTKRGASYYLLNGKKIYVSKGGIGGKGKSRRK